MKKKDKKIVEKGKYSVKVYCRNCGEGDIKKTEDGEYCSNNFSLEIPRGTLLRDVKCPHCQCKKLSLSHD